MLPMIPQELFNQVKLEEKQHLQTAESFWDKFIMKLDAGEVAGELELGTWRVHFTHPCDGDIYEFYPVHKRVLSILQQNIETSYDANYDLSITTVVPVSHSCNDSRTPRPLLQWKPKISIVKPKFNEITPSGCLSKIPYDCNAYFLLQNAQDEKTAFVIWNKLIEKLKLANERFEIDLVDASNHLISVLQTNIDNNKAAGYNLSIERTLHVTKLICDY